MWWAIFNAPQHCIEPYLCAVGDLEVSGGGLCNTENRRLICTYEPSVAAAIRGNFAQTTIGSSYRSSCRDTHVSEPDVPIGVILT